MVLEINGDGVRLRPPRAGDRENLEAGYADPVTRRFLPRAAAVATDDDTWVIADPATDRVLGVVALDRVAPGRGSAGVTYWVGPWARRRGVATAALRALSDHAHEQGLRRLELLTHWTNPVAQRVALNAGYQREGVRRGVSPTPEEGFDEVAVFARLAGDPPGPAPRLLPDLPGGELTDGVVTLRPLDEDDIPFYTELHQVPDVISTSVPPEPPTTEEIRRRCGSAPAQWLAGNRADLVLVDTATGTPTGGMGLFYQEPPTGQAMIGYSQLPAWRGLGYTTRAVKLLSLWVFAETSIERLIAGTDPTNLRSQRVLQRAGFHEEAYLRSRLPGPDGGRIDDLQFLLLPADVLADATGES